MLICFYFSNFSGNTFNSNRVFYSVALEVKDLKASHSKAEHHRLHLQSNQSHDFLLPEYSPIILPLHSILSRLCCFLLVKHFLHTHF